MSHVGKSHDHIDKSHNTVAEKIPSHFVRARGPNTTPISRAMVPHIDGTESAGQE